jgi:hypothetical protein
MELLICSRRLLLKTKIGADGFQAANLLRCKSLRDPDGFLELCSEESASTPDDLAVGLNRTLAEMGLEARDRDVIVIDQKAME